MNLNWVPRPLKFMREVLSEDGQGSYSRTMGTAITLFTCGWVTHVVIRTHTVPDLTGPLAFIGGAGGGHYLVNKMPDIINAARGNGNGNGTKPPPPA